jgi:hypothetical protein
MVRQRDNLNGVGLMDRERRLLYAVVILAPVLEAMMLYSSYLESGLPVRTMAAALETRACQIKLEQCWIHAGSARHRHDAPI